jgi:cell division septation protein DedD
MSMKWAVAAIIFVSVPALSQAQSSSDSVAYRRAQTLVNDGNATAGRAIVDSLIARAAPGTNAYAEGLYWRAVISATASDAEMDYRRIVVDYPLSPRVEDTLLRLAQLELARADYDGALQHLNRLTLEHPTGVSRARAGYWTARVLFEKNDAQRACAVTADALTHTNPNDVELRNQITYLNQRCAGVVMASSTPPVSPTAPTSDSTVNTSVNTSVPKTDTAAAKTATVAAKPSMQPPTSARDVNPSMIVPNAPDVAPVSKTTTAAPKTTTTVAPKGTTPKTATAAPLPSSSGEGEYTVQVAAYNVKSQAQAMVDKLKKRGYDARVSGTSAPFRVRIGHYPTQAQANAVMRSLKAKQIAGFVVKAE